MTAQAPLLRLPHQSSPAAQAWAIAVTIDDLRLPGAPSHPEVSPRASRPLSIHSFDAEAGADLAVL